MNDSLYSLIYQRNTYDHNFELDYSSITNKEKKNKKTKQNKKKKQNKQKQNNPKKQNKNKTKNQKDKDKNKNKSKQNKKRQKIQFITAKIEREYIHPLNYNY